jgi:chemotaxis protein methyltransferase CheR
MKLKRKEEQEEENRDSIFIYKPISKNDFQRLSELIQTNVGIKMPESKKIMLESRLHKRLRALSFRNFLEYCEYLFSDSGMKNELHNLFDVITTNKTDFFREPNHFEYLVNCVLPELLNRNKQIKRRVNFWSAGCATGEEPYSLAMVLQDFREKNADFNFSIYANDISTQALRTAQLAVYSQDKIDPIPAQFKKKYLLRSKDRKKRVIRIAPEIRSLVQFSRLNLMNRTYSLPCDMDVIFCRNVIIYFERPVQETLIHMFYRYLRLGGFLFLGHSETLCGMTIPLATVIPTVYKKVG